MTSGDFNVMPEHCVIHIYNGDVNITKEPGSEAKEMSPMETTCTMCGKHMDEFDLREHFGFDYSVGYGSKHDGEVLHARLCCNCFDNLLDYMLPLCKTSPIVGTYI